MHWDFPKPFPSFKKKKQEIRNRNSFSEKITQTLMTQLFYNGRQNEFIDFRGYLREKKKYKQVYNFLILHKRCYYKFFNVER